MMTIRNSAGKIYLGMEPINFYMDKNSVTIMFKNIYNDEEKIIVPGEYEESNVLNVLIKLNDKLDSNENIIIEDKYLSKVFKTNEI